MRRRNLISRGRFAALYGQLLNVGEETPWWLSGGIPAANCIAAYQPIGAASLAASYVNLANPGTYNLTTTNEPAWTAAAGWDFTASTALFLATGYTPTSTTSLIVRFLTPSGNGNSNTIAGVRQSANLNFTFYSHILGTGSLWRYGNAQVTDTSFTDGTIGLAGGQAYKNGVATGAEMGGWSNLSTDMDIGRAAPSESAKNTTIQAVAIYSVQITPAQMLAVHTAMAALSGPLALPIEIISEPVLVEPEAQPEDQPEAQPEQDIIPMVRIWKWSVPLCSRWTWEHVIKKVWKK